MELSELRKPFCGNDIKSAIFSMSSYKAPRPDGFQPIFFQKFWNVVGADVIKVALKCLNEGVLPKKLNKTLIVLIPKVPTLETLSQFRTISLCNVIYSAITKTICQKWSKLC